MQVSRRSNFPIIWRRIKNFPLELFLKKLQSSIVFQSFKSFQKTYNSYVYQKHCTKIGEKRERKKKNRCSGIIVLHVLQVCCTIFIVWCASFVFRADSSGKKKSLTNRLSHAVCDLVNIYTWRPRVEFCV